jgi:hypothetical protein
MIMTVNAPNLENWLHKYDIKTRDAKGELTEDFDAMERRVMFINLGACGEVFGRASADVDLCPPIVDQMGYKRYAEKTGEYANREGRSIDTVRIPRTAQSFPLFPLPGFHEQFSLGDWYSELNDSGYETPDERTPKKAAPPRYGACVRARACLWPR